MSPKDLIAVARRLAHAQTGKPKQVFLRRSISSAYYATFHALANLCANELIGRTKSGSEAWRRVYRALDHGFAKNTFKSNDVRTLHAGVRTFGDAFVTLQELRHEADYDPHRVFSRAEALSAVALARRANRSLDDVPMATRVEVATRVLLKARA